MPLPTVALNDKAMTLGMLSRAFRTILDVGSEPKLQRGEHGDLIDVPTLKLMAQKGIHLTPALIMANRSLSSLSRLSLLVSAPIRPAHLGFPCHILPDLDLAGTASAEAHYHHLSPFSPQSWEKARSWK